jgi:hypothetical protein
MKMAAKKIEFSKEFDMAFYKTWNRIGSAALEFTVSNIGLVEMVIDADRLETHGGKAAEIELSDAIALHGYEPVLKALSKRVRLN